MGPAVKIRIELDVDRTAYAEVASGVILRCFVDEDFHFVSEPERRRDARADEVGEMRRRLASGVFERIAELPPVPTLTPRPAAWGD